MDVYIVVATLLLLVIGILFVFSSGVTATGEIANREYLRQILWAVSGLILMFLVTFVDYRLHHRLAPTYFFVVLFLLMATLLFGRVVGGARRWIGVWQAGVQPSEFAKLALILFLARYFGDRKKEVRRVQTFLTGLFWTSLPSFLVLLQPDLGTSLVYLPIFLVIAFFSGAKLMHLGYVTAFFCLAGFFTVVPFWVQHVMERPTAAILILTETRFMRYLLGGVFAALLASSIGLYVTRQRVFFWINYSLSLVMGSIPISYLARTVLRDYQIMRLVVFVNPYVDPQGAGWNIIQSITAVGSGGLFGKGFLRGTQSHYQYLPAQSTDFIFSILAEEWGFIGAAVVFLLFVVIVIRSLYVMVSARDRFSSLVVAGIVAMMVFHFLVNIGMTIGLMPVTGLPLLLLSFGGSSLWTALIGLGIVMSVYQHRYQY
ncbi:rod shape-determining protein RodA [Alkalispirochaeta americana]|nr:rod shape-determining protein RodA [Alkalispirochaeta americana]